jgi:hypothetical protein
MTPAQKAQFGVPSSLGENPFPETDTRYAKWEEFSAVELQRVVHVVRGLQELSAVVDAATYAEWRTRYAEAPEDYRRSQVASWLGGEGRGVVRERFDRIAVEASNAFVHGPEDLVYSESIIENLGVAMLVTAGEGNEWWALPWVDKWKNWHLQFAKYFAENVNLPPRGWRIDPYDQERLEEKRFTPLIVRLMRVRGEEFGHDRQAVDACLDLLCHEGLFEDEMNVLYLGDALTTLCERLEIGALLDQCPELATLFAKLQSQFKKLADKGFGECTAVRLPPLTPSEQIQKSAPGSGNKLDAGAEDMHVSDVDERASIYDDYKKACRAVHVKMTETKLANQANPKWSTRDPVAKWKQLKDRPGDDALIRAAIRKGPPQV